jgi:serine/threonine protein kinase
MVFLGVDKTNNEEVAIKVCDSKNIKSSKQLTSDLHNELQVHWSLRDCDGILQLRELFEDENFVYLILDFQKGGSLLDHVISR